MNEHVPRKFNHFLVYKLLSAFVAGVAVVMLAAATGSAAERKEPVFRNSSTMAAPAAIPLAEVALQATEFSEFLRTFTEAAAGSAEIDSILRSLPLFSSEVTAQYQETAELLRGYSTLSGLQSQQQLWQQKMARAKSWLRVLTSRARQLDVLFDSLAVRQKSWNLTLEIGRSSDAPHAILRQIESTLASIDAARMRLQQQRTTVMDMQVRLARDIAVCGNAIEEISRSQRSLVKGTFHPDSIPLWEIRQWAHEREALPAYLRGFLGAIITEFEQYAVASNWLLILILSASVLYLFLVARNRYRQWETTENARQFASEVYEHPYSAALTVVLLTLTSPMTEVPAHSKAILQAVSIVPMVLLVRSSVNSRVFSWICALGVLFAIDTVRQLFSDVMSVGQAILVFESIVALAVTGWMMRRQGGLWSPDALLPALRIELSRLISYGLLLCFGVSLAAAIIGYMNMARLLAPSILVGGYLGLGFFASVRVVSAAVGFFLRGWPLRRFRMVRNCRQLLEKRIYIVLLWGAALGWVVRFLYYMGLLEPVSSVIARIFQAKFERGAIAISVGDILAFSLTVWIAYLLSSLIRFVLREEIYPRLNVAPGRSYAASNLLHYFILALGFVVAIGMMGVNLTRLTVLAGALGVGIGFGLQSVVNNFVSGLILLFERPVSAGDTIEVGDLLGEVRRIGMRSSTVQTWRGAEIIVPNSFLISEKVTNWTFSDRRRRIDIPVGVNYGADPNKVMRLMEERATAHPDILESPLPQVLFLGLGDSSINFELRAWTDKFDDWPRVRSDLVVAIYDAVSKNTDVTFPFPQRDVHLVQDIVPGSFADSASATDPMRKIERRS